MIQVPGITPPEYTEPSYPPGMVGMLRVNPLRVPRTTPVIVQEGLFSEPPIVERVAEMLPKIVVKRKSRKSRCKIIADTLDITLEEAEKAYEQAIERAQAQFEYEHYLRNKDWYSWVGTPEHKRYVRLFMAEVDRRYNERMQEFYRRIDEGKEHVMSVTAVDDEEVLGLLDSPEIYMHTLQTPVSCAIRLTEKDLRILLARGYAKVVLGDEDTLFTAHKFYEPQPQDEEWKPHVFETPKCADCGTELDYNQIGLSQKLGVQPYRCQKCLGVSDDYRRDLERFYKSQGCTMFI